MNLRPQLPPGNARVVTTTVMLAVGIVTYLWHKNIISGLMISMPSITLAVWWGGELPKSPKGRRRVVRDDAPDDSPGDPDDDPDDEEDVP